MTGSPTPPSDSRRTLGRSIRYLSAAALCAPLAAFLGYGIGLALSALLDGLLTPGKVGLGALVWARIEVPERALSPGLGELARRLPDAMAVIGGAAMLLVLGRRFEGRSSRTFITSAKAPRWRLFWAGLVLYGGVYAGGLALMGLLGDGRYEPSLTWATEAPAGRLVIFLLLLPIVVYWQAIAEEVICRGWALQRLLSITATMPAAVLGSAALFTLLHGSAGVPRTAQLLVAGVALGWAAVRTGGLEFGCGVHTAWNLCLVLLDEDRTVEFQVTRDGEVDLGAALATAYSSGEWVVLVLLAAAPALIAEMLVRRDAREGDGPEGPPSSASGTT